MSDEERGRHHHHGDHEGHDRQKCMELAERISEYVDLELPSDLRTRVEEHIHGCANCEKFVDSVRRTRDLAHLLPPLEISSERLKEISEKVRRQVGDVQPTGGGGRWGSDGRSRG